MVLHCRDCSVRDCGFKGGIKMARTLKTFLIGCIAGFATAAIIFSVVIGVMYSRNKDREVLEYVEKQIEIEALRENYGHRDPVEFLDDIPGVRGAADGAAAEFDRKRDEALQRFRSGLSSNAGFIN